METFSSEPDDPPFDIPDKWKWAKFRDVVDVRDGTHDTPKYQISGVPLVTSKNLRNGTIDFNNVKYISEEDHIEISKRSKVEKGDILFAMIGTVGNPAIVGNDSIFSIKNVALFKPLYDSKLNFEFLYYLLLFAQNQMIKESSGGVQRFVSLKYLRNFYIPVPPLGEQRRIVECIQKLRPLVDAYQDAEKELESIEAYFPVKLKASILQEAIQGKLVPQLESEPPVEQIGKLIDKIPFSIPYKWKWIQLKHATTKITDGTHHSPPSSSKGDFLYITAKNIKSSGVDLVNVTYVSKDIHEEIFKRCNPEPGDVLFIKDGATTGVVTINNLENPFSLLSSVALLKVKREILLPEFLVHVLRSQYTRELIARQMQGTGIPRVTLKKLKELWIPIPPLNEQYRISKKLLNVFAAIPCEN